MAAFDIAAIIGQFFEDPAQSSLKLPHMTTGQRKTAKKLLEEYAELDCESFGFGAERQLHLFKKNASEAQTAEEEGSTNASSDENIDSAKGSVAAFPVVDLPVRNTFIQFESATADERVVQSMPHGMFRQHLLADVSKAKAPLVIAEAEEVTPMFLWPSTPFGDTPPKHNFPDGPPKQNLTLSIGALVVVEGLLKAPAFNGRSGVVQAFDASIGRYAILLMSPEGSQHAKVKAENLRVVMPCL